MFWLVDTLSAVQKFMESGGPVLWAIAILLFLMWALMFERVFYLKAAVKADVDNALESWEARAERKSKRAHQIREALISRVAIKVDQNIDLIKTLVALAPLFGLMGTVTGMILVFDVMAITGGGDAKAMAGGVSKATIPTMSGMVAALSGVFGMTYIDRLASREKSLLEDHLTMDH